MWAHGFRDSFTPLQEVLFTFPSRYWFTIGLRRVFSLGGWSRRIHTGFHVPRATQEHHWPEASSRKGLSPAAAALSKAFRSKPSVPSCGSYNPARTGIRAVWAMPRSLATTGGITFCFLFLRLLRCFSSPRSPPYKSARMTGLRPAGLPHSDTAGSQAACASPAIFAACRVLHRLPEPRHPPCALSFFRRPFYHRFSGTDAGAERPLFSHGTPPKKGAAGTLVYALLFPRLYHESLITISLGSSIPVIYIHDIYYTCL